MCIRKIILIFVLCLLIISCDKKNFERNIIDCFKTKEYAFIVNNSMPDISERFLNAQLIDKKLFNSDNKFNVLKHKKMHNEYYELLIESNNDMMIYIQYKKQKNKNAILQYLYIEKQSDFYPMREVEK